MMKTVKSEPTTNGDISPPKKLKSNGQGPENGITSQPTYNEVESIAKFVQSNIKHKPVLGIICGSGLGGLADIVEDKQVLKYSEIPGFPVSTVPGHKGQLVCGKLGGKSVLLMQGRVHMYEGYPIQRIVVPVRVMHMMGIKMLIATNAAGGLNRDYNVGDVMVIKDHLNLPGFAGMNPLVGPNETRFGPRFPALSNAYTKKYRQLALQIAKDLKFDFVREGVYSFQSGPSFETVAECRYLHMIGADATGMSTVPEVTIAAHCGMEVLGISLITNSCIMDYDSESVANHEEVLETGERRAKDLQMLVTRVVEESNL